MSGTRAGGKLAQAEGERFESMLADVHSLYMRTGRAYVVQTAQPMRMLGGMSKGGTFKACYESEGPPDFLVLTRSRSYVIEAKRCQQKRWGFHNLKEHQANHLDAAERAGAVGVILLRFAQPYPMTMALRWREFSAVWWAWGGRISRHMPKVRASVSMDECGEHFACWASPGVDYLSGLQVTDLEVTASDTAAVEAPGLGQTTATGAVSSRPVRMRGLVAGT